MIENIIPGDITHPSNPCDIIIGMNTALDDVRGIAFPFLRHVIPAAALELGSVISFNFDDARKLHMIVCHSLDARMWDKADMYVRFGMDYLQHLNDSNRRYSIVQIGTGRVGLRDHADHAAIRTAMTTSFLPVDLYIYHPDARVAAASALAKPARPLSAWTMAEGSVPISMAA